MSRALTLVSLNIQYSIHAESAAAFLRTQDADIVALQEVFEKDVPMLQDAIGATSAHYAPMTWYKEYEQKLGVALFTKLPVLATSVRTYAGTSDELPTLEAHNAGTFNNKNFVLALMDVQVDDAVFRFGTTHFTWSQAGEATDLQRTHMRALLAELEQAGELVFTGDFNAPRGGEIWNMLATRYTDNVPPHYRTSLDQDLHRAKYTHPEQLVDKLVDGIFSTPAYRVSDVRMVCGVSDHCALVGNVTLA